MRLPISSTLLAELGRWHVKKFHTNIYFVQHHGESSPHQSRYHGLAGWFRTTIEPDANREYSGLWGQFLHGLFFKMIYVTLIVSSNGPGDVSSHPLLPGLFWRQFLPLNFLTRRHRNVATHSFSLSLPLSPHRKQPCLKAQTTEHWLSHMKGECIARIAMSSSTGIEKPHKRTFTACSTSAPTFRLASFHMHAYFSLLHGWVRDCV
jgi:hypothetical protein